MLYKWDYKHNVINRNGVEKMEFESYISFTYIRKLVIYTNIDEAKTVINTFTVNTC